MQDHPPYSGLSDEEARRLADEGRANVTPKAREGGVADILRRNVFTLFNLLNLILAGLLMWVGSYRDMLFAFVAIANVLIGVVQELRAKRTHDRLRLLSESPVRTVRSGRVRELASAELVEGDVILLARGEQIPADAEILEGVAHADESLLTGESVAVRKKAGDTLYSGSFLVGGAVTARLTAVGANSYAGRLQTAARKVRRGKSELMRDMGRIIRWVSGLVLPVGAAMFARQYSSMGLSLQDAVTKTVASVLGMIPEGLILLTSVSLAAGVVKLGRRQALVNELYGIETLARTDVVCMDKTGTLTNGEMTLEAAIQLDAAADMTELMTALVSTFPDPTPTNRALRAAYPCHNPPPPLAVAAFSSERKWSAAQFERYGTLVLGAPERLLSGEALAQAQAEAARGLRVLALARADEPLLGEELPKNLRPQALVCLRDMLRPNARDTVRYFGEQDVALKVISGDNPLTVARAAEDAGIPDAARWVDMSALPAERDYTALARGYTVFGRVSPEDKRGLIQALKRDGHGVAMVGDGVNDIPALKEADCSIAMAGGSDAASRVSQVTLLDGDFGTLPLIVLEGRRVINNITRASSLFLVKNIFSLLLSGILLFFPFVYPFAPIQLTLISCLTIGTPSFVLALQPSRDRVRGSFLRNVVMRALPGGVCAAALIVPLMAFAERLGFGAETVSTLSTLMAGYSGLVALLLTCLPLNPLRAVLVALMGAGFAGAAAFLPGMFYLTPIEGIQWAALAAALPIAPALQIALGLLLRRAHKQDTAKAQQNA